MRFYFVTGFKYGIYHTLNIKARDDSEAWNIAKEHLDEILRCEEE